MKRTLEMKIRFTQEELEKLTQKAKKAGLSREGFCRRVLNGETVKEAPPVDVPVLIREVRRVGSNLDQILAKANAIGLLDVPELRRTVDRINAAMLTVMDAYGMGVR